MARDPEATALRSRAVLLLLLATVIWGASFVVAKGLVADHDPLSILVLRFALGAVTMGLLRPRAVTALSRTDRRRAALLGLLLGAAQVPHYFGIRETSASAAAFLIGTYVVATPVCDRLLHGVRSSRTVIAGAGLAMGGLVLFASGGSVSTHGLVLCLVAAVLYAVHISTTGAWVPAADLWGFTTVTVAASAAVLAVPAALRGIDPPTSAPDWLRLLYLAVVAGGLAVAMQSWAQRHVPATSAAVILVGEPLWAAVLAVLLIGESLSAQLVLGGVVLVGANLLVAVGPRDKPGTEGPHAWS